LHYNLAIDVLQDLLVASRLAVQAEAESELVLLAANRLLAQKSTSIFEYSTMREGMPFHVWARSVTPIFESGHSPVSWARVRCPTGWF
jgi:hypothetical protein